MKVLITGGAGFIGSNLADCLLSKKIEVVIVDSLATGHIENINPKAVFYKMDIRDANLKDVFEKEKPAYVFHLASQIDVQKSINDPSYDASVNVLGTINLLEQCRRFEVEKVIYASSAAVYGSPMYLGIDEAHRIMPMSFYGITKHTAEHYLKVYKELYGLKYTILRYSNVYGPRQQYNAEGGVVAIFINKLLNGEAPVIYGDGEQTRDFVFVKDIAEANYLAIMKGDNEIINISTNKYITLNYLLKLLKEITMSEKAPIYKAPKKGDIKNSYLENKKACEILSWHPKYRLEQGLRETVEYYQNIK